MNESLLVNALGHSAGVLIFGIFLYLLIQDRAARRLAGSTKSMIAAALAFLWNLTSLIVLGLNPATSTVAEVTAACGFSVLSLLPAVLFDLCLRDRLRALVHIGYALSAISIVLHLAELGGEDSHRLGLALIIVGYGTLTFIASLNFFTTRDRATTSRLIGTMLLFLMALSFVHFRSEHSAQIWSRELAFHHAAIPLALLVLLQDYRFVLLDAFLRFLANIFLAAILTSAAVAAWRLDFLPAASTPFLQALYLAAICVGLVVFALLRGWVQGLLTRLVFRSPDRDALLDRLNTGVHDEATYLAHASRELGAFVGAEASLIRDVNLDRIDLRRPALVSELPVRAELEREGAEAVVPLRFPWEGSHYVVLGRRSGGRRYLSEDLQALARAASQIVEHLEQYRESEMRQLVAQAELRALQSQIHPHFLFNALNTLYGIIPREAKGARETVLNLADIFRYFLETGKQFLPLEEEIHIVKAYLDVERLRLGAKLEIEIDVAPEAALVPIPILSIQPLVENAIRHGIAPKPEGGLVRITAAIDATGALRVKVRDTGGGFKTNKKSGVGLDNVSRRLQLCYGPEARLHIQSSETGSEVSFTALATAAAGLRVAEVAG